MITGPILAAGLLAAAGAYRGGKELLNRYAENRMPRQDEGAMLLWTRSARRHHGPTGTNEHGGQFYDRDGIEKLHITQYFADQYRVSWDVTPRGVEKVHWTKQDDYGPNRHTPPDDALI